jgi:GNAT superfamily N-acetyltransferase
MPAPMLTEFDAAAIVPAIECTLVSHTIAYVRTGGGMVHDEGHLTWVECDVPLGAFNGVLSTALPETDVDAAITLICAHFRARRMPMLWWVGPAARPDDLGARLVTHGLSPAGSDRGMALDLCTFEDAPFPSHLTVERVRDGETMAVWLRTFAGGFEMSAALLSAYARVVMGAPPERHPAGRFYLARLDGEPAGTAGLFCDAGVANIVQVCTVPSARRRGVGEAATRAALHDARQMGYRIAVLRASEEGFLLYRRMGFVPVCTVEAYRQPTPSS